MYYKDVFFLCEQSILFDKKRVKKCTHILASEETKIFFKVLLLKVIK